MTRADVIYSTFQAPVRTWIMENARRQKWSGYLDEEDNNFGKVYGAVRAYSVLDEAFNWGRSKEGHDFWSDIHTKLQIQGR